MKDIKLNDIIKNIGIDEKNIDKELQETKQKEKELENNITGGLYLMFKDILDNKNNFIFIETKKEKELEKKVFKLITINENKIEVESIYNIFMDRYNVKGDKFDYYKKIKNYFNNLGVGNKDILFQYFKKMLEKHFDYKIVKGINYKIDLTKKQKITFEVVKNSFEEKELIIISNQIFFNIEKDIFKMVKNNKKEYEKYIKIYKEKVFTDFDTFLDIIIYNLFSKDRRHSFIYLNVKEGFGKSFLMKVFESMNIGIQTNLENLTKNPSPLSPESFKNKVLLMIDEFTSFKKELKELNNSIILNPKNQKQVSIELYTKLFVSKEKSESLSNIVDKQITDRIIYFNYTKNIDTLQDLVQNGIVDNVKMFNYVKYYIYIYFLKKIKRLKNLEKEGIELNEYINKQIFEIHEKFELKVENPDKLIFDLFKSYTMNILRYLFNEDLDNYINNIDKLEEIKKQDFEYQGTKFKLEGHLLYFSNLKGFTQFLMENVEEYDFKKLKYKISNIHLFNVKKINKSIRFNKVVYNNYYMFDLRLLKGNVKEIKSYFELEQENEKLIKEVLELKEKVKELEELKQENEKLKEVVNNNNDKQKILELENKLKELEKEFNELKSKKIHEYYNLEIDEDDIPF